jgi:hypothetical protein
MNQEERQELVKYRIKKARETFNEVGLDVENTKIFTGLLKIFIWLRNPSVTTRCICNQVICFPILALGYYI